MSDNSQLIDRYLQNEMSAEERAAFEKQLAADKILKEEFTAQQQIVKAAETAGLKTEFARAVKKRIITHRLIRWGAIITIIIAGFLFYAIKNDLFNKHTEPEHTKGIQLSERFDINNTADTIIETKDGVVFAIPANAFAGSSNTVQLEIKMALTAYDIMRQGLSTMSNADLLQTAGMFYINGYENGKPLLLIKEIAVSVPASNINSAMQLFDGVEDSNGHVNWVNPKQVENKLRTYDISTLDFYPPDYIPALKALQKNYQDKRYTDSLYYSFSGFPFPMKTEKERQIEYEMNKGDYIKKDTGRERPATDTTVKITSDFFHEWSYEIDPARIRAIWNKKFNNTIIATKEFEERLRFMHSLCTSIYLDIYLQNLNKPLHYADKLCAGSSSGEVKKKFLGFAARKDGAVIIATGMQEKLSTYFQQKYAAYKKAAAKVWASHEAELMRLSNIADAKQREQEIRDFTRENETFQEELCINLTEAYRQIGVNRSCKDTVIPPAATYYNITISTTGWKNLDMYVLDATTNRQGMSYTDPITGKTALLNYIEITMQIENRSEYDKVLMYLLPDSLSSFQRVQEEGNVFKENLNSLFRYDAVVLAYKGRQAYYYRKQALQPVSYTFILSPVTDESLRTMLKDYSLTKTTALRSEFGYQLFEQQESIRQVQLQKNQQFREQMAASIFNCSREGTAPIQKQIPLNK